MRHDTKTADDNTTDACAHHTAHVDQERNIDKSNSGQ